MVSRINQQSTKVSRDICLAPGFLCCPWLWCSVFSFPLSPQPWVTPHCSTAKARAAGRKEHPRQSASTIFQEAFIFQMADADLLRQHFPQKHTGSYRACSGCCLPGSSCNFQPKSEITLGELKPEFHLPQGPSNSWSNILLQCEQKQNCSWDTCPEEWTTWGLPFDKQQLQGHTGSWFVPKGPRSLLLQFIWVIVFSSSSFSFHSRTHQTLKVLCFSKLLEASYVQGRRLQTTTNPFAHDSTFPPTKRSHSLSAETEGSWHPVSNEIPAEDAVSVRPGLSSNPSCQSFKVTEENQRLWTAWPYTITASCDFCNIPSRRFYLKLILSKRAKCLQWWLSLHLDHLSDHRYNRHLLRESVWFRANWSFQCSPQNATAHESFIQNTDLLPLQYLLLISIPVKYLYPEHLNFSKNMDFFLCQSQCFVLDSYFNI